MKEERVEEQVPNVNHSDTFEKNEKRKTRCKKIRNYLRLISFGEYRTPLYFNGKDSYKSAASGILTKLSALTLVFIFFMIFIPIFQKQTYEITRDSIRIVSPDKDADFASCENCRNFTVKDFLEVTFTDLSFEILPKNL